MPQKVLRFTGINRKVNEFQSSGACEELINLRPTSTGLEVVRPKKLKFEGVDYDVYNHTFADKSLFIGVVAGSTFEIFIVADDGSRTEVDVFQGVGNQYSIVFLGNKMVISNSNMVRCYAYKNGSYVKENADAPSDLNVTYTVNTGYGSSTDAYLSSSDLRSKEFLDSAQRYWSAAAGQSSRKDETFGPVMVAFNFSLSDGTEFWTNKWIYINPFLSRPVGENGKHMIYYEDGSSKKFTFDSYRLIFKIAKIDSLEEGSMIDRVNVYATRPIFPYNPDTISQASAPSVHDREVYATVANMEDLGITKELLYYQKSIKMSQLRSGDVTFTLNFDSSQAGEKVLEIDNGPMTRAGQMVSLNNRAHVYNSYATIVPQSVVCETDKSSTFYERDAYVYIECYNQTVVRKTKALVASDGQSNVAHKIYCCYPDQRAKKILIYNPAASGYGTINLQPSSSYNYAWGEGMFPNNVVSSDNIIQTSNKVHEPNVINVSEQYNPFVFPVKYSYSVGGEILDVTTAYLPISATEISRYPVNIFTTEGIYALEQGNGTSLYGGVTPLQPMVIQGKAIATPKGTFFVSSKNLYVLTGLVATDVSSVLKGELENGVRNTLAFNNLCRSNSVHDFTRSISDEDFDAFINDVSLAYDQLQNELHISSNDANMQYAFVLNIDTMAYHKVDKSLIQHNGNSRYVIETVGSKRNVVDLHAEEKNDIPVLLLSRPQSLEVLYTHIQRLVMLVDTKLSGDSQKLLLSVFAGDNLHDWKCVISAQKANTTLAHIRTNKAPKSYKYYVVVVNGIVPADTDISDIIADYTVVNRRLG